MTDFKLDPKKYEGHTKGPLGILRPSSSYEPYGIGAVDKNGEAGIIAEVYHEPDAHLFADAPDILAYAVRGDNHKADLIEALTKAEAQFRFYAQLHSDNGMRDKAKTNHDFANMCLQALYKAIGE